jgi:hypothetical protein
MKCFFTLLSFIVFNLHLSFAQSTNDTSVVNSALENALATSRHHLRENLALYNGKEYVSSDYKVDGFPTYEFEDLEEGSITYYDQTFDSIPLLYDIYTDEVIVEHYNSVYALCLNSQKVSKFSLPNHSFIRITNDSAVSTIPKTGFYEILYVGDVSVFARRKKTIFEEIVDRSVHREYVPANFYFIKIGEVYHSVKSKRSVLALFKEHKKEINKSLRKNKIKFRKSKETALVTMAAEFDKLSR